MKKYLEKKNANRLLKKYSQLKFLSPIFFVKEKENFVWYSLKWIFVSQNRMFTFRDSLNWIESKLRRDNWYLGGWKILSDILWSEFLWVSIESLTSEIFWIELNQKLRRDNWYLGGWKILSDILWSEFLWVSIESLPSEIFWIELNQKLRRDNWYLGSNILKMWRQLLAAAELGTAMGVVGHWLLELADLPKTRNRKCDQGLKDFIYHHYPFFIQRHINITIQVSFYLISHFLITFRNFCTFSSIDFPILCASFSCGEFP